MSQARDITGLKFGLLTAVTKDSTDKSGHLKWLCRCICGNVAFVTSYNLCRKQRPVRSCVKCRRKTHSMSDTPQWHVWCNLRYRCSNPDHPKFSHYGGRGISVCNSWANSFEAFWANMKAGYEPGLYLDRIDNNGNYEPGNCRWVTPRASMENRSVSISIVFEGETMSLSEAARRNGLEYRTLLYRFKNGFPESKLFFKGRFTRSRRAM
jgi:hypothetical protein